MRIVFALTVLSTMLFLASQGDRRNYSPTYLQQRVVFKANLEKAIAQDKENLNRNIPMARRLDGVRGGKSIKELMDGFRGFL